VVFHPFHADRPELRDARSLGDLFYVIEGLLMAHRLPGPDRRRIGEALERIFHGDRGVLKAVEEESWWEPTDAWEESKRSGLLYLWLVARREMEWDPRPEFESRLLTAISESPYREWLGVCVSPEAPEGLHAYQATGFAGMSAAAAIEPGWVLAPERTAP
jgi:hypothetical protein